MREPLVLPLLAVAAGLTAGKMLELGIAEAAWPVAAFAALSWIAHRHKNSAGDSSPGKSKRLRDACLLLALFFTGASSTAWHRAPPTPEIDAGPREVVTLTGCVVEPSAFSPGRERFTLELDAGARARVNLAIPDAPPADASNSTESSDGQVSLAAPPVILPVTLPMSLRYGQRVEVDARVRKPHNFQNPGAFDYVGYLARQDIYWTASVARGVPPRVLEGRCGSRWRAAIFAIREAALGRLEHLYAGDEYATGMMEALLLGETSRMEKVWTESFRKTGTFHALVISGAHVAVLAGLVLFLLRLCAIGETAAMTTACLVAWLYALVSGFTPPVARSAGAFTLYLIARYFFRRPRVLNLLAAFAILYLLLAPGEMPDASFELSFFSVVAIAALAAPLVEATFGPLAAATRSIANIALDPHLTPRAAQFRVELRLAAETIFYCCGIPQRWALRGLAALLRIALAAVELAVLSAVIQVGLALPMAEYFHRVSFTGITANLVVVPLLELAIPFGFLAIFLNSTWVAAASLWLLKIAALSAAWHARIEPQWRITDPPAWLAIAFAASLILFAIVLQKRVWRWPAGIAVLSLFALLLWQPWPPALVPNQLELTAIDVGQGDSLLVVFPEGKIMLVDGGGVLSYGGARPPNLDIGEDVVSPYLWTRGIRHIDILAATHAHADHTGGLAAIINNFRPTEVWVGPNPLAALVDEARRLGIPVEAKRAGEPFSYAGAEIQVLSPPPGYTGGGSRKQSPGAGGNNDSLALRIRFGKRAFLLAGDMERAMELNLVSTAANRGESLEADVLKVGHHGSKTSTTQAFADAVNPSIGVISAGFENSYGHPHRDVVQRLALRRTAVLRTDLDGLITVRTDGQNLKWISGLDRDKAFGSKISSTFNWGLASSE